MTWTARLPYGHFSPETDPMLRDPEGLVLDPDLMERLDHARHDAATPFIVTSGVRSEAHNAAVGGASQSAHLIRDGRAYAVDGYFSGWPLWEQFIHVLRYGFRGVGLYPFPPPGRDPTAPWVPVVHVDTMERGRVATALWIRTERGSYVSWPDVRYRSLLTDIARGL